MKIAEPVFCAYCGQDITPTIEKRHYSPARGFPARFYCDKECRAADDTARGFFKAMSLAGKAGRSRVMPVSNRENPRKKRRQ